MAPNGNMYALAALRERRAGLAAEVKDLESRRRHLLESMTHVDSTLPFFDPNGSPPTIKPEKPYKRVKLFGQCRA